MCTLTWTQARPTSSSDSHVAPEYQLWFNRDEMRARAAELPPRLQVSEDGVRFIAPEDSEAGGTWITANEHGVTVALLNGYAEARGSSRSDYTSRGVLVRSLAGAQALKDTLDALSPKSLKEYHPAVIFVKTPGVPALVVRWDGQCAALDFAGERQLPLTSSSYEQDEVQRARRDLYRTIVSDPSPQGDPLAPPADRLAAFQNYVDPSAGPTHLTPIMGRSDAATRSQCVISVTEARVSFSYRPLPSPGAEPSAPIELRRVGR